MIENEASRTGSSIAADANWHTSLFDAGCIVAADVHHLRNEVFPFGLVSRADAEKLFRVEREITLRCTSWAALFCDLVTDYVVWGERPTGTIDPAMAAWILHQVDTAKTDASVKTLSDIFDEAQTVPDWFKDAVAARTGQGAITGTRRSTADGSTHKAA